MRLLDTNVMIDVLRGHPPALQWLVSMPTDEIGLPGLVVTESLEGCANMREARAVQRLIGPCPIYWPTAQDCERALAAFARYYLQHNLGILDALIGECAVVGLGVPLVTFNVKHFRAMAGLTTEQPYERV